MKKLDIEKRNFSSGLTAQVVLRKGFKQKFFGIIVDFGSSDKQIPGSAHYLEHLLFSKKSGDITERFDEIGASTNAFTSYNATMFYASSIDNVSKTVDLLFELVGDPNFSKKSIDKERPIIAQELAMYRDEPTWPISDSIMKQLFGESNLGLDIGGTSQTIKQINSRNLARIYRENYTANNMHFIAVGDFAPSAITRLFSQVKKLDKQYLQSGPKRDHTFKSEAGKLGITEFKNKTEVPYFCLGIKLPDFKKVLVNNDLGQILFEIMLESMLGEKSAWYQEKMLHGELTSPLQFDVNYTRQGNFVTILGINNGDSLLSDLKTTLFASEKYTKQMNELREHFEMLKKVSLATLLAAFNNLSDLGFELAEEAIHDENIFDTLKLLQRMSFEEYWQICQDLLAESKTCSVFSTIE